MDNKKDSKKSSKRANSFDTAVAPSRKKKKKTTKNPVIKMTTFFEVAKNPQGFSIHQCRYQKAVNDRMYVPKNYGENLVGAHVSWIKQG